MAPKRKLPPTATTEIAAFLQWTDGLPDNDTLYENSKLLTFFGGRNEFFANHCYNDGHVNYTNQLQPDGHAKFKTDQGDRQEDDVYVHETSESENPSILGSDAFLCMTYESGEDAESVTNQQMSWDDD